MTDYNMNDSLMDLYRVSQEERLTFSEVTLIREINMYMSPTSKGFSYRVVWMHRIIDTKDTLHTSSNIYHSNDKYVTVYKKIFKKFHCHCCILQQVWEHVAFPHV